MGFLKRFSTPREGLFVLLHPWLLARKGLQRCALPQDPWLLFDDWYRQAKRCLSLEFPNALCLATVTGEGRPDCRMVLLKDYDVQGFTFYTNSLSAKGQQMRSNPWTALTFYWAPLQRQIRIQGKVQRLSDAESDAYFATRPRESQLGAWASPQSQLLSSRDQLEQRVRAYTDKFRGQKVPRPEYWCGYCVRPLLFEFWQLRLNRLHDRICYQLEADGTWSLTRLAP